MKSNEKSEQRIAAECIINHSVAMSDNKESIAEYTFDDWCNVLIPIIQEKERWEALYQKEAKILHETRNDLMNKQLEFSKLEQELKEAREKVNQSLSLEKFIEILDSHSSKDMGVRYMNGDDDIFIYEDICKLSTPHPQRSVNISSDTLLSVFEKYKEVLSKDTNKLQQVIQELGSMLSVQQPKGSVSEEEIRNKLQKLIKGNRPVLGNDEYNIIEKIIPFIKSLSLPQVSQISKEELNDTIEEMAYDFIINTGSLPKDQKEFVSALQKFYENLPKRLKEAAEEISRFDGEPINQDEAWKEIHGVIKQYENDINGNGWFPYLSTLKSKYQLIKP